MDAGGLGGDKQGVADLAVAASVCDVAQDLTLAWGQIEDRPRPGGTAFDLAEQGCGAEVPRDRLGLAKPGPCRCPVTVPEGLLGCPQQRHPCRIRLPDLLPRRRGPVPFLVQHQAMCGLYRPRGPASRFRG